MNAWLKANALTIITIIGGLLAGAGGLLVARARADDRVEQVARDLASDRADLARHEAASEATHSATSARLQRVETLVRDAAWNGYFVCVAQAKRPELECIKPEVPR